MHYEGYYNGAVARRLINILGYLRLKVNFVLLRSTHMLKKYLLCIEMLHISFPLHQTNLWSFGHFWTEKISSNYYIIDLSPNCFVTFEGAGRLVLYQVISISLSWKLLCCTFGITTSYECKKQVS